MYIYAKNDGGKRVRTFDSVAGNGLFRSRKRYFLICFIDTIEVVPCCKTLTSLFSRCYSRFRLIGLDGC